MRTRTGLTVNARLGAQLSIDRHMQVIAQITDNMSDDARAEMYTLAGQLQLTAIISLLGGVLNVLDPIVNERGEVVTSPPPLRKMTPQDETGSDDVPEERR